MANGTVQVTLNFMGVPVRSDFPRRVHTGEIDPGRSHEYALAESFFELPLTALSIEVLERYAELSTPELYLPFLPHTEKLFERLLAPFKSAKRCYCLGEFLAAIELCAHVAEMLAQLVWEMEPLSKNPEERSEEVERAFFGRTFEKLGQEHRIRILAVTKRVPEDHVEAFTYLRTTRRKYFHLWDENIDEIQNDALAAFKSVNSLVQGILQISVSSEEPGKVVVNPTLSRYLDRVRPPVDK
ncbi:MAG: hypothetical protein H6977_00665 [Gammaproteobacteria bacterium]|nr:hypothetical protein [Gammaproteobacteria bacterium]